MLTCSYCAKHMPNRSWYIILWQMVKHFIKCSKLANVVRNWACGRLLFWTLPVFVSHLLTLEPKWHQLTCPPSWPTNWLMPSTKCNFTINRKGYGPQISSQLDTASFWDVHIFFYQLLWASWYYLFPPLWSCSFLICSMSMWNLWIEEICITLSSTTA